jgi:hypothetical protein
MDQSPPLCERLQWPVVVGAPKARLTGQPRFWKMWAWRTRHAQTQPRPIWIEIQGDHRNPIVAELEGMGYQAKRAGG